MPFERDEKIIRWCISAVLAVFAFINGFQLASLILLLTAVIVMPIKAISDFVENLKPMVVVVSSLAMITVGLLTMPEGSFLFDAKNNYPVVDNRPVVDNSNNSTNGSDNSGNQNSAGAGSDADEDSGDEGGSDSTTTPDSSTNNDPDTDLDNKEEEPDEPPTQNSEGDYILNTSSKKFHKPTCFMVKRIDDKNKKSYSGSRSALIKDGYEPCGHCDP